MIWRLINAILLLYLLLIALRIMLSWFRRSIDSRPWALLVRVTEPYLSLFRRLKFLSIGALDLSPLAGILALVVALDLLGALQSSGRLSLGILLASLTGALWSGFSFLAVLFLVAVVVLILFVAFRRASQNPVSQALATLVFPVVSSVRNLYARIFSSRKPPGELQALLLTAVLLVGFLIGGRALILLLRAALANLPF